jgi:glycosyltransferase involved in cell wall biosynthesis
VQQILTYLLLSFLISVGTIKLLLPLAKRLNWVDHPNHRKNHDVPTPVVGGLGVFAGIAVPVFLANGLNNYAIGWFSGALLLVIVGLINPLNMADGIDGLVGSLVVASMLMFISAGIYAGIPEITFRLMWVIGAVMGFLYTDGSGLLKRLIKALYKPLIQWICRHLQITVIVQNQDDFDSILSTEWVPQERIVLIAGSGVVLDDYVQSSDSDHIQPLVILPARLIREKGILEFVEAAKLCKATYPQWRFALVGTADYQSSSAISRQQIEKWVNAGIIEWFGYQHHLPTVFRQCAIVWLPSFYMEGLPKCLLEAAAAGKPVVTTNSIGCREAIVDGETGILIPVKDVSALVDALLKLMANEKLRNLIGQAGRVRAFREFDIQTVIK